MDELSTLSISLSIASLGIFLLFFYSNDDDDQDGGKLIRLAQKINKFSWIISSKVIDNLYILNICNQRKQSIIQQFLVSFF